MDSADTNGGLNPGANGWFAVAHISGTGEVENLNWGPQIATMSEGIIENPTATPVTGPVVGTELRTPETTKLNPSDGYWVQINLKEVKATT